MFRRIFIPAAAICTMIACSSGPSESKSKTTPTVSAEVFVGTWRSITPSYEFIGLTVVSKSSEQGALGARLTFSGVYWEGSGKIDGDSLVADMTIVGSSNSSGVIAVSPRETQTLHLQFRQTKAPPLELTFVRE